MEENKIEIIASIFIVAIIAIIVLAFNTIGTIPSGYRGVKVQFDKVVNVVQPGLYAKVPFIENIVKMDVRTQTSTFDNKQAKGTDSEYSSLAAASSDLQDVAIAVVTNYHLDPKIVGDIFQQYGTADNFYANIVEPIIRDTVKTTASTYTAEQLVTMRADFNSKVTTLLTERLVAKNIVVEKVNITNFEFSPTFTQAIESKVTAVQNAEAAKNKLEQVKYEAQQAVETAKGEAQAISVKGEAIRNNPSVIELNWIEKWNGITPTYWGYANAMMGLK